MQYPKNVDIHDLDCYNFYFLYFLRLFQSL